MNITSTPPFDTRSLAGLGWAIWGVYIHASPVKLSGFLEACCCRCRVLLIQGAAVRVLVPLQGVAARCPWQCGALGPAGDYVYAVSTGECLVAAQEYPVLSGVYAA